MQEVYGRIWFIKIGDELDIDNDTQSGTMLPVYQDVADVLAEQEQHERVDEAKADRHLSLVPTLVSVGPVTSPTQAVNNSSSAHPLSPSLPTEQHTKIPSTPFLEHVSNHSFSNIPAAYI